MKKFIKNQSLGRHILFAATFFSLFTIFNDAFAAKRALVIGISEYKNVPKLENPKVDVVNVKTKLESAGYNVTLITDPNNTRDRLLDAFDRFLKSINLGDEVIVYYSGHGVDVKGNNMFVPADSPAPQDAGGQFSLSQKLIPMRPLMMQIEDHEPIVQVWIIDACRNDPYADGGRDYVGTGGLSKLGDKPNSFVFFAADYSQIARDKLPHEAPNAANGSPFSRTFVSIFDTWKDKDISLFASQLRRDVVALVKPDPQFPVFENGVLDQWCFVTCSNKAQEVDIKSRPNFVEKGPKGVTTVTFRPATNEDYNSKDYVELVGEKPVVFLGKESAIGCRPSTVSDLYPFSCKTLRQLADHFNSNNTNLTDGLVGQSVKAETEVNIRRGLPHRGAGSDAFGCKIRTLKQGESVKLISTIAIKYPRDTFYWGIVDGISASCLGSQKS